MGIKNLMKLLNEEAPLSVKDTKLKNYTGKRIAIDASMQLYQYFVMIRASGSDGFSQMLTSEDGKTTSHIQGFFNRTIKLMESGIKPVYVFDGKPPDLKSSELSKRKKMKEKVNKDIQNLMNENENNEEIDESVIDEINKLNKRTVHVTKEHNEQVKKLLNLMGVPIIESPGEAEAQCARLCSSGLVYATGTEDMDALTFGTNVMIKNLTFSGSSKRSVQEINLQKVLKYLNISRESFIDLCILCGCDYSPSIRGIGHKKAYALIKKHGNLEDIFKYVSENTKYEVPTELSENLETVRNLFKEPDVLDKDSINICFKEPDVKGLTDYLVTELNFDPERVSKSLERLHKTRSSTSQTSIDSFFKKKTKN